MNRDEMVAKVRAVLIAEVERQFHTGWAYLPEGEEPDHEASIVWMGSDEGELEGTPDWTVLATAAVDAVLEAMSPPF